jgi:primosomal protein N' (replication factor Y)
MKRASKWFGDALRQYFKEAVLGPEPPPIGRIRNLYISNILIKISKKESLVQSKEIIHGVFRSFHSIKEFSSVRIIIDVDPY